MGGSVSAQPDATLCGGVDGIDVCYGEIIS